MASASTRSSCLPERVERQVTGGGKRSPEILQLSDQCLGFVKFALDLEPALMQQRLQTADQRELWHGARHAVARLGVASGDDDADREDPRLSAIRLSLCFS
jgi:hypothetical protein